MTPTRTPLQNVFGKARHYWREILFVIVIYKFAIPLIALLF